jgi:hypothetical protein
LGGGYIIYLFDSLLSNKAFAKLIISGICKKLNLFTGSWITPLASLRASATGFKYLVEMKSLSSKERQGSALATQS